MIAKAELAAWTQQGDKPADEAFAALWPGLAEEEKRDFFPTLGRWSPADGLDKLPRGVAAYIGADAGDLPDWIDMRRVALAQQAYSAKHLAGARIVLATYSLPVLYIHPEISLTLATTEQLLMHVRRRYEDTQAFVEAVMQPGSLEKDAPGRHWIRKIRLMHAAVRAKIFAQRNARHSLKYAAFWSAPNRGHMLPARARGPIEDVMPVDQAELAFVLQTFAWCIVEGLREMGWGMSKAEAANHVHAWAAVGWMLGIDEKLLPRGPNPVAESERLFVGIRDSMLREGDPLGPVPGDRNDTAQWGRYLVAAWMTFLVQMLREHPPAGLAPWLEAFTRLDEAFQQLPRVMIRRLCGDEAARCLRVGHAGLFDRLVCGIGLHIVNVREVALKAGSPPGHAHVHSGVLVPA